MNEDFLHYVWKYQLFSLQDLKTTQNGEVVVLKTGLHNQNAGPDFLNAKLKIDNQVWGGNVEIHVKSSDWYAHHHEVDSNYDAVILHVVWEDDTTIFTKNNSVLPTLLLKNIVFSSALKNYQNLFSTEQRWIPCEKEISTIDAFVFENWKERLFFERLARKSEEMNTLLVENNFDFEATFFQVLAKSFGLKVNGDAFLRLAKSIDFNVLRKVRFDSLQLEALLYGKAGFLEDDVEEVYHQELKLFSKILATTKMEAFYELFSIQLNNFWKTHYTFEKASKASPKKLTKSFIDLLVVNTIIPLKFLYQKHKGKGGELSFLDTLREIASEKNSIISKFNALGVSSKSAYDSQALLELKNNYCTKKRCLHCAIGLKILK